MEIDGHESDNNHVSNNMTMFVICVIVFLLIIIGWITKNKKTHMIYFLNGVSVIEIVKDLYLKTFLLGMVFSVLVPVVLFVCFVGKINVFTNKMIFSLFVNQFTRNRKPYCNIDYYDNLFVNTF